MAEPGWYDAGEVKPRDIQFDPRCPDCETGGMKHPAHRWGPCMVRLCACTKPSATPPPPT